MVAPSPVIKVAVGFTMTLATALVLAALMPGNRGQQVASILPEGPRPAREPLVLQIPTKHDYIDDNWRLLGLAQTITSEEAHEQTGPDTDPNTFFVSPTGDEGNDGQTAEAPWQNLQASIDRLQPGQTLFLMDGVYSGQYSDPPAHWIVRHSGKPDAWIRVAAAPGHTPILHPNQGHGLEVRNASYVEVEGLTVVGQDFGGSNDYGWGMVIRESHHVRLIGNDISDMPVGGISAVESSKFEIIGNTTHHNSFWGPEQGSGISVWHARSHGQEPFEDGYHIRIVGNTSYANENKVYSQWAPGRNIMSDGNGIIMDLGQHFGYGHKTLIANNIAFNNGGRGINITKSDRVDVVNNTTYHNGRTPTLSTPGTELSATNSKEIRFYNNLSVSRPGLSEIMISNVDGLDIAGNVFVTDKPSGHAKNGGFFTTNDPGFVRASVDPNEADFRLTPGSVALSTSTEPFDAVNLDWSGAPRPEGQAAVGAFELSADESE